MTKQHSGNQVWTNCATLADKTLLPLPSGPNMMSGSVDEVVIYLKLKRNKNVYEKQIPQYKFLKLFILFNFVHNSEIGAILAQHLRVLVDNFDLRQ